MPELSYQEAVELYWRAASEEDPDASVNQPSTPGSWREEGGWRLENVNGFLAFVSDEGEVSYTPPD
jgi:hypothetical protein